MFVEFSLGQLAAAIALGPVVGSNDTVGRVAEPSGWASGSALLARRSRRSGIVAVTDDLIAVVGTRTAYGTPRGPAVLAPRSSVRIVRATRSEVAATLDDGSVARFCFGRMRDAARFVALW